MKLMYETGQLRDDIEAVWVAENTRAEEICGGYLHSTRREALHQLTHDATCALHRLAATMNHTASRISRLTAMLREEK